MSKHRHEMSGTTLQKSWSGLPAGYTRLEYVTSNNNIKGYIDTEVIPEETDYIQIDIYKRDTIAPFGADNFVIAHAASNEHWRVFNTTGVQVGSYTLYAWQQYIYKDGYLSEPKKFGTQALYSNGVKCRNKLYLFRRWSIEQFANAYISYCKIEKANGYVKELIPAIRNSDGMVGMYDIANHYFHVPPTGYLIAGPSL